MLQSDLLVTMFRIDFTMLVELSFFQLSCVGPARALG